MIPTNHDCPRSHSSVLSFSYSHSITGDRGHTQLHTERETLSPHLSRCSTVALTNLTLIQTRNKIPSHNTNTTNTNTVIITLLPQSANTNQHDCHGLPRRTRHIRDTPALLLPKQNPVLGCRSVLRCCPAVDTVEQRRIRRFRLGHPKTLRSLL